MCTCACVTINKPHRYNIADKLLIWRKTTLTHFKYFKCIRVVSLSLENVNLN